MIIVCIIFYLIEIFMLIHLITRISKNNTISLKDTSIYPFIVLQCTIIVIIGYMHYGHLAFFDAAYLGITNAVNVVKLGLDAEFIELLKISGGNAIYLLISYYIIYAISLCALVCLLLLLFITTFKNALRLLVISFRKEVNIVFGLDEDGKTFITNLSDDQRKKTVVVLDSSDNKVYTSERFFLNHTGIAYITKKHSNKEEIEQSLKKIIKNSSKKFNIVTFFSDQSQNLAFTFAARKYLDSVNAYGGYYYVKNINRLNPGKIYYLKIKPTNNSLYKATISDAEMIDFSESSGIYVFRAKTTNAIINIQKTDTLNDKRIIPYHIDSSLFKKPTSKKELKIKINTPDDIDFELNELCYQEQANINIIINTSKQQKAFISDFVENCVEKFGDCRTKFLNEYWEEEENVDRSQGIIHPFDKYDLISYNFIFNHNFAKYFPKELINDDCTVKDCDINLYVFGYGKVNQAVLRDCLINTSFVRKVKVAGGYKLAPVRMKVKVYDKKPQNDDLETSIGYIKYNKNSYNQDNFLPLVDNYLSKDSFNFNTLIDQFNVIDGVYDEIKEQIENDKVPQVNYFLISFDSDYANWNFASKLENHLSSIDNSQNIYFYRTKEELTTVNKPNFISFGVESSKNDPSKVLLSYDNVVKDDIYNKARIRHFMYVNKDVDFVINGKEELKDGKINISEKNLRCCWAQLPYFKKTSNLYAIASINFKLDLMKLNSLKSDDLEAIKNEYHERYEANDEQYAFDKFSKAKEVYSCREVLAFMEHERWNSFEIAYGALPLRVDKAIELTNDNGKFINQIGYMYHLCITTAQGLVDYYHLVNDKTKFKDGKAYPEYADVIKYDYSLMDYLNAHPEMLSLYKTNN